MRLATQKCGNSAGSPVTMYNFVDEPADPCDRMEMVSRILVESLEPLDAARSA